MTPRDGTIEAAITNAETDLPTLYAGAEYHPADGTFSVYGRADALNELKAYFQSNVDADLFDTIEFVGVERSLEELYAIQQEIGHEISWFKANGISLAGASIEQQVGMIEISLHHYTPEAERLILERFGADRVRVDPENAERLYHARASGRGGLGGE